ncbi:MAG: prolyl oligopeptidase family serine peptidase, partial [Actinomycetota bacterium]
LPEGRGDCADIEEARVAADPDRLLFLVRTVGMSSGCGTAVLVLVDTEPGGSYEAPGGLRTGAEWAFVAAGNAIIQSRFKGVTAIGVCPGPCVSPFEVATNSDGFTNAIEIGIRRSVFGALPAAPKIGLATALVDEAGTGIAGVSRGAGKADLINVAFRFDEPIRIWMDGEQAGALRDGNVDRYVVPVDIAKLLSGYTETFEPRPGYWERIYVSDSPVNREVTDNSYFQGAFQHYGVYLPSTYRRGRATPATWWTHYRGGHAHDAAAWVPGLIRQLGEQQGNIVISPGARGTSSWYVGRGHEDFLETWDDSMATFSIDPDRVYLSGYSMGGFASWLLGMLYPDRWAGAFPTSGPPTQGLWLGIGKPSGSQEGGDVEAQLTFNIIENARNVPYVIYHGTDDELVPSPSVVRMALRFTELGYRNRLYLFPGYEHYTHAIVDEWVAAARYLNSFRRDPNPARVTYRVWPAMERAVETVSVPEGATLDYTFDGAYWVDDLEVRSGNPQNVTTLGTFDGVTFARGVPNVIGIP